YESTACGLVVPVSREPADQAAEGNELVMGQVVFHAVDAGCDPLQVLTLAASSTGARHFMIEAGVDAGDQRSARVGAATVLGIPKCLEHRAIAVAARRFARHVHKPTAQAQIGCT